jgi:hypothetical protein
MGFGVVVGSYKQEPALGKVLVNLKAMTRVLLVWL